MLAFSILAMITGALGVCAVNSVVERPDVWSSAAYDKPLMAISYARLAQADFNALELAIERLANDPASKDVFGSADQRALSCGESRPHGRGGTFRDHRLSGGRTNRGAGIRCLANDPRWDRFAESAGDRLREQTARGT